MSSPVYLDSSPSCSQCPPALVRGAQPSGTPSAGGRSRGTGTATRGRLGGGTPALSQRCSGTGRSERERAAIEVTAERRSGRGPSRLRGGAGVGHVWGSRGCCHPTEPGLRASLLRGNGVTPPRCPQSSLGKLVLSPRPPDLPPERQGSSHAGWGRQGGLEGQHPALLRAGPPAAGSGG